MLFFDYPGPLGTSQNEDRKEFECP
jgi:hypothetical protein